MKKIYFLFPLLSLVLFSCSEDNDDPQPKLSTVTFEAATLADNGTLQGTSYTENGIVFDNYYTNEGYEYNSGYTVSNNTDQKTEGFANQYSVYANGGADDSKNFAIYNPCYYGDQYIHRADNQDFAPHSVAVALTTYTYLSTKNGDAYAKKFEAADHFTMTVKGLDAANNVVSSVDVKLISNLTWWTAWQKADLSALGKVNKLLIDFSSSDSNVWDGVTYMNTPAYIALDNFAVKE